jgi:hypothetical protein
LLANERAAYDGDNRWSDEGKPRFLSLPDAGYKEREGMDDEGEIDMGGG